ncbi:MAG: helix-turn-helix domain-containing protein [Endomicrobium sp.]|jgi:transcriptional regulator with XRE-family HTH domain|nr:helix-turn-helix domain-containing protein [Endomicrobium sp.]
MGKVNLSVKEKIKQAMLEAGFTQRELAKKLGVTNPTVNSFINRKRNPTVTTLKRIAKATNKPLSYFFEVSTGDNVVVGKSHNVNSGINSNRALEFELLKKDVENLKWKMDFVLEKLKK